MGWLSRLTGFFSGGPGAASKVLDAGIQGLDALIYTDEEKAVARQKLTDTWLDTQKILQQESSIRSVSRRIIAWAIIFSFILLVLGAAAVYPFNEPYAAFLLELASSQFGWLVLGIAGFYFGPSMLSRMGSKGDK